MDRRDERNIDRQDKIVQIMFIISGFILAANLAKYNTLMFGFFVTFAFVTILFYISLPFKGIGAQFLRFMMAIPSSILFSLIFWSSFFLQLSDFSLDTFNIAFWFMAIAIFFGLIDFEFIEGIVDKINKWSSREKPTICERENKHEWKLIGKKPFKDNNNELIFKAQCKRCLKVATCKGKWEKIDDK